MTETEFAPEIHLSLSGVTLKRLGGQVACWETRLGPMCVGVVKCDPRDNPGPTVEKPWAARLWVPSNHYDRIPVLSYHSNREAAAAALDDVLFEVQKALFP